MRNKLSMVAALGLALSLPAVSFGGQQSAEGAGNPSKASHKTNHKVAKGEVSAVDLSAKTLTLHGRAEIVNVQLRRQDAHQASPSDRSTFRYHVRYASHSEVYGKGWQGLGYGVILYPAHHKVSTSSANK